MLNLKRIQCLGEILRDAMIPYKSNIALIEANRERENKRWTYHEVHQEAERFGALLQEHQIQPGDRCVILMSNQSKWILSGLSIFWVGAILIPLDYKLTVSEQLTLLQHADPQALIIEYPLWRSLAEEFTQQCPQTRVFVTETPATETLLHAHAHAIPWETLSSYSLQYQPRQREDVATIVYTSGTSGTPKGCMLTHQNYLEQIQSLSQCFAFQEQDRYFSILPTNHAIDFMCGFIAPLLFGATIVHQRTLRPQFLLSTMRKYQITLMALVPRILKAFEENIREELEKLPLWQQPLFEGLKEINHWATQRTPRLPLSRLLLKPLHDKFGGKLRLLFCGGAFVEKKCAEFFYQLGFPVVIGYGMTEACTVITLNDLQPFRANSVGRPLPQNLLKIQEANDEGIGEVWVKSPTVMKAYFKEPEQTQEVLKDGWLKTGDLGFIDASGHLKLLGRSKNIIVTSGGKNVYPEDLEASFQDLKGYEEYCILATHFIWGHSLQSESLTLIVRPQESSFSSEKFQQELLQKNLQLVEFKRLSYFLVWHSPFPRTASLKIKRELLAKEISSSPQSALVAL